MELLIILLVGILVVFWYFTQKSVQAEDAKSNTAASTEEKPAAVTSTLDVNQDGKVDVKDAVEVVKKARGRAKKAADLDGDGKVTLADAKVAVKKTRTKVTETVAKTRGRSKKA